MMIIELVARDDDGIWKIISSLKRDGMMMMKNETDDGLMKNRENENK